MNRQISTLTKLGLAAVALALGATGCELIAVVDRSLLPGEGGAGGGGAQTTTSVTGTGGSTTSSSVGGGGTTTTSSSSSSSTTTTSTSSTTTTTPPTCPTTGGTTCQIAGDCPAAALCTHTTCDTQNCCGVENDTLGTSAPPTSQTAGDCQVVICDGNGATKTQVDDGDVPAAANDCSVGTCNLGTPGQSPIAQGTACTSNGGKLCDGAGACVKCLANADCTDLALPVCDTQHNCVAATCTDTVKAGLETDVDCGGGPASGCSACADGKHCVVNSDCVSGSFCKAGVCTASSCSDGVKDGSETDTDCGGTSCVGQGKTCANGKACLDNADCASGYCPTATKLCTAPTCTDGVKNGLEGDVDCGATCGPTKLCAAGLLCNGAADCATGFCDATGHCAKIVTGQGPCSSGVMCESGFCALPEGICCATDCLGACQACSAAKTGGANGTCAPVTAGTDPDNECATETASTCGTTGVCNGSGACALYATGTECVAASCGAGPTLNLAQTCDGSGICSTPQTQDCSPYNCANGACPTSCTADADCISGDVCTTTSTCAAPAADGATCGADKECTSGACYGTPTKTCHATLCSDGIKDGVETDVDCGGTVCLTKCGFGKGCGVDTDCATGHCVGTTCGCGSDTDCAGTEYCDASWQCVAKLADGTACGGPSQCQSGFCYGTPTATCHANECFDGLKDALETDVDCGGGTCGTCAYGKGCLVNGDCGTNICTGAFTCGCGSDTDCAGTEYCNASDLCVPKLAAGDPCSLGTECTSGFCYGTPSVCHADQCSDGIKDGLETGVDCGGLTCAKCGYGDGCLIGTDCTSGQCNTGSTCGCTGDGDCVAGDYCDTTAHLCAPKLADGATCTAANECTGGFCYVTGGGAGTTTCHSDQCSDGLKDGTETDVDCGGSCSTKCADTKACALNADCTSGMCHELVCVADVNGCTIGTATDLTAQTTATITFDNGNLTYSPSCIKVKAGTVLTFNGDFTTHPLLGGTWVSPTATPDTAGPFVPVTNTGTTKDFTMSTTVTYPYYCTAHVSSGMMGAVFVVP